VRAVPTAFPARKLSGARARRSRYRSVYGRIVIGRFMPHFPPVPRSKSWCSSWRSCRAWPASARRAALVLLKKREALLEPLGQAMREAAAAIRVCADLRQSRHDESMCGVP